MNTLDELIYYCKEDVLAGTLMLNGDWGCGKTHMIEHELKQALEDTHLVVRVSLFGIADTASLDRAVRKGWLAALVPALNKLEKHEDALKRSRELVEHSLQIAGYFQPFLQKFKGASTTSDEFFEFLPIQNKIKTHKGEREFVLVFDDLERTKLSIVDAMGCINGFCENQQFKTIIVTNEEKIINRPPESASRMMMRSGAGVPMVNTDYLEIKEKMICRTVRCVPEYKRILHAILLGIMAYDKEYQNYLLDNEAMIESIFDAGVCADGQTRDMALLSYNFRTLRCALIDFCRVYHYLAAREVDGVSFYLYNFIALEMTAKSSENRISTQTDEEIDRIVKQKFPLFDGRYMPQSVREWILNGVWDEARIAKDEQLLHVGQESDTPEGRLRRNMVTDLEEDDILNGFEPLLKDAYAGGLSLDEYVTFIKNAGAIRRYEIDTPCEIDWEQVMQGIELRFRRDIESNDGIKHAALTISRRQREDLSAEELSAYDRIEAFRQQNRAAFENSRRTYLQAMKENGIHAFTDCENLRFNCFDEEMASATADGYEAANQVEKRRFSILFREFWKELPSDPNLDSEKTNAGFAALKVRLEALREEYRAQKRGISAKHTEDFLRVVDEMIGRLY